MAHTNTGTTPTQADYDKVFALMDAAIRLNEYGLDDWLEMLAEVCPQNPALARALMHHSATFMRETAEVERDGTTVTDIIVESYRRALFDAVYSPMHGTGWFMGRLDDMTNFVTSYIQGQSMGDDAPIVTQPTHPARYPLQ